MNNRIRELCAAKGWSEGDFQVLEGSQTVNALENARYHPSLPLAFSIARTFAMTIQEVFRP